MSTLSLKPLYEVLKPYEEVLEGRLVEALNLADIYVYNELRDRIRSRYAIAASPLTDPVEFLRRTHFSDNMVKVILRVFGGIAGMTTIYLDDYGKKAEVVNTRVFLIPSLLGGGKTHLLATLYFIALLYNRHGTSAIQYIRTDNKFFANGLKRVFEILSRHTREVSVVALVGDVSILAPSPSNPVVIDNTEVYTPWGLLALLLGEYDEVREYDRQYRAPPVDILRNVFRGKRALILIDEPAIYLADAKSLSTRYPGCDRAYVTFIRNLAEAVSTSEGVALVVTVPAEYREKGFSPSRQHPEEVMTILDMIRRVQIDIIPPLEIRRDIIEVFRKRIFKNIDSREVIALVKSIVEEVKSKAVKDPEFKNCVNRVYGDIARLEYTIEKYYPFHPFLIDVMIRIGSKIPSLGMTRGLLAFIAKLVRYLYVKRAYISWITLWNIPLEESEHRTQLISELLTRSELENIYESDVGKYRFSLSNLVFLDPSDRESLTNFLKYCLAKTIWITTIPGEGRRTIEALETYPAREDIPLIIYDPLIFKNILIADVLNTLQQLLEESTYLVTETSGGVTRVFYAIMPDITRIIRDRYRHVTEAEALITLENYTRFFRPGRKFKRVVPIHLTMLKEVEELVDQELSSDTEPKLFIYLALAKPRDELKDVILKRNNIALLLPNYDDDPRKYGVMLPEIITSITGPLPSSFRDALVSLLKLLSAIRRLRTERDYLAKIVGEDMVSHVMKRLKEIEEKAESQFTNILLTMMNTIILGKRKREERIDLRPTHEGVDLSKIASAVEDYLERIGVRTSWTWQDLYLATSEWTELWDIDQSLKKPIKIRDLWRQLIESPGVEPHITGFNDLVEAIREGYESGRVAFKYGAEIIWLKAPVSPSEADQLVKTRVSRGLKLLTWDMQAGYIIEKRGIRISDLEIIDPKYIIRDFIEEIKKSAQTKPGERVVKKLVVNTGDEVIDFSTFIARARSDEELVELLSRYPVVLIEETPELYYVVKINSVNNSPYTEEPVELYFEEKARVKIVGEAVSDYYPYNIRLTVKAEDRVEGKEIVLAEQTIGLGKFELEVYMDKPGEYLLIISGIGSDPKNYKHPDIPIAKIIVSGFKCSEFEYCGEKIIELTSRENIRETSIILDGSIKRFMFDALQSLFQSNALRRSKITGKIEISIRDEGAVSIELNNVRSSRMNQLISFLRSMGGIEARFTISIKIEDIDIETLLSDQSVLKTLSDTIRGLATLSCIKTVECWRVGHVK
ncbi:MAG: DUF499 domain-containing protein [Thermoprotei archaeon]